MNEKRNLIKFFTYTFFKLFTTYILYFVLYGVPIKKSGYKYGGT